MEAHLAQVNNSPSERAGLFGKKDFEYDPQKDVYRCPAGQHLTKRREMRDKGRRLFNYDHPAACAQCGLRHRCTEAAYRTVSRWEHEECLERMAAQVAAQPEKLAKRKALIEHCWGTLKWVLGGGFLLKGLKKVGTEVSLAHLVYNLKRALKVVGLKKLLESLIQPRGRSDPQKSQPTAGALGQLKKAVGEILAPLRWGNLQAKG